MATLIMIFSFSQEQVILDLSGLEETWTGVCQIVLLCKVSFFVNVHASL